jgi:hypothetical protein
MSENEPQGESNAGGTPPKDEPSYRLIASDNDPTKGDTARAARRRFLIRGSVAGPFLVTLSSRPLLAASKNKRTLKLSHNTSRRTVTPKK